MYEEAKRDIGSGCYFTGGRIIVGIFKTFATIFATLLATCVIAFVALLIFDLSQQIYGFLHSLYQEIVTRFF